MDGEIPHQRVYDLLRQMRGHLLDESLISAYEYGWLISGAPGVTGPGSPAPRRLERYDEMRERLTDHDRLRDELRAALTPGNRNVEAASLVPALRDLRHIAVGATVPMLAPADVVDALVEVIAANGLASQPEPARQMAEAIVARIRRT